MLGTPVVSLFRRAFVTVDEIGDGFPSCGWANLNLLRVATGLIQETPGLHALAWQCSLRVMNTAHLHDKIRGFGQHPKHHVGIEPGRGRATVEFNRVTVADSDRFVIVNESGYSPVVYFPRKDVATDMLVATDHHSYCPFKGKASFWTLTVAIAVPKTPSGATNPPMKKRRRWTG